MYRRFQLTANQSAKVRAQIEPMLGYFQRFVERLRELNVDESDPLFVKATAAAKTIDDLRLTVTFATPKPSKEDRRKAREQR